MTEARPNPRAELLALVAAMNVDVDIAAVGQVIADQNLISKITFNRIAVETVCMAARGENAIDLGKSLAAIAAIHKHSRPAT